MKKVKYFYNTQTLKYEKLVVSVRVKILRILGFLSAAIVTGVLFLSVSYRFLDSPKEKSLRREIDNMKLGGRGCRYIEKLTLDVDENGNFYGIARLLWVITITATSMLKLVTCNINSI